MPAAMPDRAADLIAVAIRNRPELKELRLQQGAAERFAKAEHALFYPSVGVLGTAGFVPAGEAAIPGRYGAIGMNVNIPIFNGGLFRARQTEAELQAKAAQQNVNDLQNRVMRDVRVAWLNATTAYDRIALTHELLQQAQLSLDLAQSRFDLGLGSFVDLSQAQLNLTSAAIATASALYDYQVQRLLVDYQTGVLH
jgi:outer membrane protein